MIWRVQTKKVSFLFQLNTHIVYIPDVSQIYIASSAVTRHLSLKHLFQIGNDKNSYLTAIYIQYMQGVEEVTKNLFDP